MSGKLRLVTLGRLALLPPPHASDVALDELNSRRRKVALLAFLALRQRPVSRDTLLEIFWGGHDEVHARHSLSDATSHLRRILGHGIIVATRAELSLARDAPLVVDAIEFAELAAQPAERRRAIEMYGGRFMDGVYVDGSDSFDLWVSSEQLRLERLYVTCCERECLALGARGNATECAIIAQRWLEAEPLSVRAALALIDALAAPQTADTDARACAAYERLCRRLARELDTQPDAAVADRARQIADRMRARPAVAELSRIEAPATEVPAPPPSPASQPPAPPAPPATLIVGRPIWRRRAPIAIASGAVLFMAAAAAMLDARRPPDPLARPVLAVADILSTRSDTATDWLVDALPQMIASKLLRVAELEVVPPAAIRAIRARGQTVGGALSPDELRDLGKRAGATFVVNGAFMQRGNLIMLDLRLHDVATGRAERLESVADSSVLALIDRAVVRLLDAVGASTHDGPRLAEVETASLAAYQHFVRANQLRYEHPAEAVAEFDAAIALDSGFTSAVLARAIEALAENDAPTVATLGALLQKHPGRVAERDRLEWESRVAFMNGSVDRAEALARLLVEHHPRDPRGFQMLAMIYDISGRWDAEERVLERMISLDSLAMEAGRGPCVSCDGLATLTLVRLYRGDWSGAERVATRWTKLTPEMSGAWTTLALAQAYHGNFASAAASVARGRALTPDEPGIALHSAWIKLMSRDLEGAEAEIAQWETRDARAFRAQAIDMRAVIQRERGQFRAANATIQRAIAEFPELGSIELVRADGLARTGQCGDAIAAIEMVHPGTTTTEPAPGSASRAFAWHHALLADFIARVGECGAKYRLEALADSIERIGRRSYYGRDWTLHHHVRGLIAERSGDLTRAEEELTKAQWRVSDGWSRSTAELAKVQLARGRVREAIQTLRNAYATRPDAMGRYQPRSELDYLMSVAFRRLGQADSARVYAEYTRRAWAEADPEVRRLLRNF